ncbi:MAG: endonuclease/exonuclease/phosphatase family protein [Gemmatimonadetes bacterium]|nr:endonuclease/exonuclease/phosphatase family protein [Gemmatimonadota bacterium]
MSIVVSCAGGEHEVRLAKGRFWASARCPKCRRPVDPTRLKRIRAWLSDRYLRSARTRLGRIVWASCWAYLGIVLFSWGFLWTMGDRVWPATIALFGPRWLLLLPAFVLGPLAIGQRAVLSAVVVAALVVLGPVMGFQMGWRGWFAGGSQPGDLRVVTFNAEGGLAIDAERFEELIRDVDVVAIQECNPGIPLLLESLEGWHFENSRGSLCLASRFPIGRADQQEHEALRRAGGSGWVIRYRIDTPSGPIELTNVHLDTPRSGFEQLRRGRIPEGIEEMGSNSITRDLESRRARRWANDGNDPRLIVGDFNMPTESAIYRRHWGDLTNAYSTVGVGFGHTRYNGWIRVRIDHILTGDGWRTVSSRVGPDLGSDHRPMIAELRWEGVSSSLVLSPPGLVFPYRSEPACPGEGCSYGEWLACDYVPLYETPGDPSSRRESLSPDERFEVETGAVITDVPGVVVVKESARAPWVETSPAFVPGDTLYVLGYAGDGFFDTWYHGSFLEVEAFWSWETHVDPDEAFAGEVIQERESSFWVRLERAGLERWVWVDSASVAAPSAIDPGPPGCPEK